MPVWDPTEVADERVRHGLLGPDGRPLTELDGIRGDAPAAPTNPDYRRDERLERHETVCPDFPGHPCPEAAQMLWLVEGNAGTPPPWWFRVSGAFQARYGRETIARALWPYGRVLWDAPMVHPHLHIEFNWPDQDTRNRRD